ncbi:DUF6177 family protein [Streptomyces sp. NPDC048650]|uniref:DUF6177 family protein n=1 Tax=unclassified Streptomyces TaxID=2593676 RepID=UPI0037227330
MTTDVIALTERMPDVWTVAAGMLAGGPESRVAAESGGAVLQLSDGEGRPLASIEAPILVHTPGEAVRLLGPDYAWAGRDRPVWWTEIRAATGARGADRLAGVIASRLVGRLGGTVWPRAAAVEEYGETASGVEASAGRITGQAAIDVLTDKAAVIILDRPVVAMTAWLADAVRATAGERALQIVTPPGARLTLPVRTVLSGHPHRWVVQDGEGGYYDGLSGSEVHWQDGQFTANGELADAFVRGTFAEAAPSRGASPAAPPDDRPAPGGQLLLSLRTHHPAEDDLLLGGALEDIWHRLTGAPPAGWGTEEPAASRWSRQELTALVRDRAPEPTWLVVVGRPERPAIATLRVRRTSEGVEEDMTVAFGFADEAEVPLDELPAVAERLVARHGLESMIVQRRGARADLAVPAQLEAPPLPVAFVLGSEAVREVGIARARRTPLPDPPQQLGPAAAAGFLYPLGAAGAEALERLMAYLHPPGEDG